MSASRTARRFVIGGSIIAAALALTACGTSSDSSSDDTKTSTKTEAKAKPAAEEVTETSAKSDVTITKSGFADDETYGPNSYVVHYKITNSTDKPKDYFAQLRFLDKDGDLVGSTGVTAIEVGSGKTNTGSTAPLDVEIDNGKISDIKSVEIGDVTRTAP